MREHNLTSSHITSPIGSLCSIVACNLNVSYDIINTEVVIRLKR